MRSARFVYSGLALFFLLALASIIIIVDGTYWPTRAGVIAVGDRIPSFALPNTEGCICEIQPNQDHGLMLLSAPTGEMTRAQQICLREIETRIISSQWLRTIALVSHQDCGEVPLFHECQLVLVDEYSLLWPITGVDRNSASICVVSSTGSLQSRYIIAPDGTIKDEGRAAISSREPLYAEGGAVNRQ